MNSEASAMDNFLVKRSVSRRARKTAPILNLAASLCAVRLRRPRKMRRATLLFALVAFPAALAAPVGHNDKSLALLDELEADVHEADAHDLKHALVNLERDLDKFNNGFGHATHHRDHHARHDTIDRYKPSSHTIRLPPLDWDVINSSPDHPLHEITTWREQLENEPDMERHIAEVQELQAQLDAATTDEERMFILKAIKNAWKGMSTALNTIAVLHSVWKNIKTATGSVDIEAGLEIGVSGGIELGTAAVAIYVHVRSRPPARPPARALSFS